MPGAWLGSTSGRQLSRAEAVLPQALRQIPLCVESGVERWRATSRHWTSTGTAAFKVALDDGPAEAIVRIAPSGRDRLQRETWVLGALGRQELGADLLTVLPQRLGSGEAGGMPFVADRLLPGASVRAGDETVQAAATTLVTELHHRTARPITVDEARLSAWVDQPLAVIAGALRRGPLPPPRGALRRVSALLRQDLAGRPVQACWIHGDFWTDNLLVDGSTSAITGIIDWDLAASEELPVHDVLHLLLHARAQSAGIDLGDVLCSLLEGASWSDHERSVLDTAAWSLTNGVPDRSLVLLYWLRHVAAVAVQQRSYVDHSVLVWRLRNIHRVLRRI